MKKKLLVDTTAGLNSKDIFSGPILFVRNIFFNTFSLVILIVLSIVYLFFNLSLFVQFFYLSLSCIYHSFVCSFFCSIYRLLFLLFILSFFYCLFYRFIHSFILSVSCSQSFTVD